MKLSRDASPDKISLIVLSATILIMSATMMIGYQAYVTSRDSVLNNVYESNLDLARAFRDYSAIRSAGDTKNDILHKLRTAWNSMDRSLKSVIM